MAGAFGADELMRATWSAAPVIVSLSTTTARSTLLPNGVYYITADVACLFLQGGVAVDALTTSNYLPAGAVFTARVTGAADGYIAGILASGTGNLYIMSPV